MGSHFRRLLGLLALGGAMLAPAAASAAPLYHLAGTIPLGGSDHWDYMRFGPDFTRLYVSHGTELTVVDPSTDKVVGHVTGLDGSHGEAFDPQTGLGYADSSGNRTVTVFTLDKLTPVKTLPALEDADGIVFDPFSNQVFVVGGDANAVLAMDASTNTVKATVPLGGAPEFLAVDGNGHLFVNLNDKNEIVKLDTKTGAITARWNLPGCTGPTGLAMDTATHTLFSSCANGEMAVVNADTGALVALLPIGKGTDSAAFDPVRHRAFSANADGTLSIIQEIGSDHFKLLPPVRTAPGARTIAVDERNGEVFIATAQAVAKAKPKHPGHLAFVFKPGTMQLLVFTPAS